MPLTTIAAAKELAQSYQPLLLAEITLLDGTVFRASTENLDLTAGGIRYSGHDYPALIRTQDFVAASALSDNGVVQSPEVTVVFIDANKLMWNLELLKGFKGAKVKLTFVFWDAGTSTFSSDARVAFVGLANPPSADASTFTLSAVNLLNLARINLPTVAVSGLCGWPFPATAADRGAATWDEDSVFHACGYGPDASTSPRGNFQTGTTPYTFCNHTKQDCIARMGNSALPTHTNDSGVKVQIEQDKSGRNTGTFGGITWMPPQTWRGNAYTSGTKQEGYDNPNLAKFNDWHRLLYGKTFVNPVVMNAIGDPNYSWFEATICLGQIHDDMNSAGPVEAVLINDDLCPHISEVSNQHKINLAWFWVSLGSKFGGCNRLPIYDGSGDPYGSLATIVVMVPNSLQASTGVPNIRVLTHGPKIRVWHSSDPADFTHEYTSNPAWIILDLLTWANFKLADLDLQTFLDAATYYAGSISYTDLVGATVSHARYTLGLVLAERRSAAETLRGVLVASCAILRPSTTDGTLQLFVKRTSDVQPSQYSFDDSNILMTGSGANLHTSLAFTQRRISDTQNAITAQFADEDNHWTPQTVTVLDSQDITRAHQQVDGSLSAEGLTNWDQARRVTQCQFAESFRGNPRTGTVTDNNGTPLNDTGGTLQATFTTTARCVDLRCGDVITLSSTAYGIESQLFRVTALKPTTDFETCEITAKWTEDDWYEDSYGQDPSPYLQAKREQSLLRSPFEWAPNYVAPDAHDSLYPTSDKSFAISQQYSAAADGSTLASLSVQGKLPINQTSVTKAPFAPQATASVGGGTIPAGTYWLSVAGVGADSRITAPTKPAKVVLSATGTLTLPNIHYGEGTTGYKLYAGTNPNRLTLQVAASGTPSSVTLTSYHVSNEGMPDSRADHIDIGVTKVYHSGVFGMALTAGGWTGTTITYAPGGFTPGMWVDYTVSILGLANSIEGLGIWDFKVTANTADTLTLDCTDLNSLGVAVGDAVVMRAHADVASSTTIGCTGFVNSIDYYDAPLQVSWVSGTKFTRTWPGQNGIYINTVSPAPWVATDKIFVSGVKGVPNANGLHTITTVSADKTSHYCDGTSLVPLSSGSWTGGGEVSQVTSGLEINGEVGRLVRITTGMGAGQERKILSNDHTTLTVSPWLITPDSTSTFIILDTMETTRVSGKRIQNHDPAAIGTWSVPMLNFSEQMLLVEGWTMSADGKQALAAPAREIYLFGGPGPGSDKYYLATFGIGIGSNLVTGTTVAPLYIVRKRGTLDSIAAVCKTWPTGADIVVDLKRLPAGSAPGTTPTSIFGGTKFHIPAGATSEVVFDTFLTDPYQLEEDDILSLDVTQVGSTQAGRDITIHVKILEN